MLFCEAAPPFGPWNSFPTTYSALSRSVHIYVPIFSTFRSAIPLKPRNTYPGYDELLAGHGVFDDGGQSEVDVQEGGRLVRVQQTAHRTQHAHHVPRQITIRQHVRDQTARLADVALQ